ncbi:uncharacterized protein LOC132554192 [Ylistrum balloti]|uniref:uncharacterized protein LOC132554192 n=1 Tax=Ylistrum balloti TaxID=509963 RepID=UPI002905A99D|nr:uncharacterized protein LOC132554192 [Ylistrum balloti]XP_060074477.1 uncharacterized protein LOC132554192 [Ylistrum balloti]XP_060074478.1 uncharacterized protein LOC132554192 [Ylistrum balloti]
MEPKHKEELRQNFRLIVNNVADAEAVCDELLSLGVFEENDVDKILLKKPAPKEQTKELLYLLKFRGVHAYNNFILALKRSGNTYLADQLMKPDVVTELPQPQPTSNSVQPSDNQARPSDNQAQPSQNQVQPSDNQVRPSDNQAQPSQNQIQPSDNQARPSHNQARPSNDQSDEDLFKRWPFSSKACIPRECTGEERHLMYDETVYRITNFRKKGFVLRMKCQSQRCKVTLKAFDLCNMCLDKLMNFLNTPIRTGLCSSKLFNKTADEYKENVREIISDCREGLENAGFFMMFFLSYGAQGERYGQIFDKANCSVILQDIIKEVTDCEALKDKPKIFIVITIPDQSVTVEEPPEGRTVIDAGLDPSSINEDNVFVLHVHHGQNGPWTAENEQMWFMKAFCDVFYTYSYKMHFLELIEKVNELLSNAVLSNQDWTRGHVGEVRVIQKDIRKKLYFFPGIEFQTGHQATS